MLIPSASSKRIGNATTYLYTHQMHETLHVIAIVTLFQSIKLFPQMSVYPQNYIGHQCEDGQRDGEEEDDWFIHGHIRSHPHF